MTAKHPIELTVVGLLFSSLRADSLRLLHYLFVQRLLHLGVVTGQPLKFPSRERLRPNAGPFQSILWLIALRKMIEHFLEAVGIFAAHDRGGTKQPPDFWWHYERPFLHGRLLHIRATRTAIPK